MPRPSASATASRFAANWVADALAADDALDFSSIMALLDSSPEYLAGAPESASERVALRCLQELSAATTTGDGPTASRAPAGMLRVDINRSCEDLLLQIIGEVGSSASLRKDMLPAFSQDIQNIICIKKPRLPETCFELLREVDREIACMALPSPVEQNGDSEHDRLNIEEPRFPTDNAILRVENLANLVNQTCKQNILKESIEPTSDLQQGCISDTTIPRVDSNKTHLSSPQNDSGEKANQDLDYEGTSIQRVEKDSVHEELPPRAGSIQGDKSETNHLLGNSKEHAALYDGNCHLEVCCADKVNQFIFSDGGILEKNMAVCGGPSVQSASGSHSCNKFSEDSYLSEQNNARRTTDVQKLSRGITVPVPPRDGDGRRAKQISNKETLANTAVETSHFHSDDSSSGFADKMLFCIKDQGTNSFPRGCTEQDLCIKCGKDGILLKCYSCLLAAHDSCFGSSVVFEVSGQFCCPVCFYTKATKAYKEAKKTYCEASKNLAAFFGTQRLVNQRDEQPPEVLPRASPSNLNGCNSLKRKHIHRTETHKLACADEKADQQRKKQKINAPANACPEEAVSGKAPSVRNSDVEPMNKHSILQNINKKVQDAEKEHQLENTESREETRNGNSCDGTRNTSHEKFPCSDEKADQQRKKQKINAPANACPDVAVSGKAPSVQNSDVEPMNKHSIFQNISKKVHDAEKEHQLGNTESREETRNENSCDGTRNTSHEKCSPSATNQEVEANKEDGLTNCNESENSGEKEATSLNDAGQRSLPPLHNIRHHKARSCNSGKAFVQQGQHMPSPSRKRNYAYPIKLSSDPVAPTGRRSKLSWTDDEEAALREAMETFNPQDNRPIPWVKILEYGRHVFHPTRLPCDLRVKWRNMMKKAGS